MPDDDKFLAHWSDPALFSYTVDPKHLLRQLTDYLRRRADIPKLGLVLLGSTLTDAEIDSVLNADDPMAAARALLAAKLNRLS